MCGCRGRGGVPFLFVFFCGMVVVHSFWVFCIYPFLEFRFVEPLAWLLLGWGLAFVGGGWGVCCVLSCWGVFLGIPVGEGWSLFPSQCVMHLGVISCFRVSKINL